MNYIDLFAGAGGLSEGFIRQGFEPVAHVEMNKNACDTLKTRAVFLYLKSVKKEKIYYDYLQKNISRDLLWSYVPVKLLNSVINTEISDNSIKDIFNQIDNLIGRTKIDIIIGGPPCQAYSIIGRARDPKNMLEDPRNFLYNYYIQFLVKYKPKMFIFENVPGILSAKNGEHFKNIKNAISDSGYIVDYRILDAKDFGVLQKRKRVILIGWQNNLQKEYPTFEKENNNWQILKDLFYDLPALQPGTKQEITNYIKPINDYLLLSKIRNCLDFTTQHEARPHNERDLKIYSIAINKWINERKRLDYSELKLDLKTHKNQTSFLDRFQVVDPLGCSHTVVAHIANDGHYYIYPDKNQIRSISVREAARIQSFPDDYFFEGGRTAAFKQIGNAVPPLIAEAIACKLKDMLNNEH
jgi:DNA (cytosine-5)-methyltransferase 1